MNEKTQSSSRQRRVQAVLLVLLMALPAIQSATGWFPRVRLSGSEALPERPSLSLSSWFDGSYAPAAETWFAHRLGFRGLFVRLMNQVHYSVFGQIPESRGTPVTLGENNWLYETEYVKHYRKRRGMRGDDRRAFVNDVKRLQDALAERGIVFALVISPSKPEVLPDYLPDAVRADRAAADRRTAYEEILPDLREAGVRYVDARAFFEALRDRGEEHLFARGGTHWTYYSCFLFCRHLLERLREELPESIVVPELANVTWDEPRGSDRDLAALLNLVSFGPLHDRLPYPEARTEALPIDERPDILMVGDSFAFTLLDALNLSRAAGKMDLFYYHRRYFEYPEKDIEGTFMPHAEFSGPPIDRRNIDWERYLLDKEIVLLEINEILLRQRGWRFVQDALSYLDSLP